jgi:hypothetical protein
VEALYVAFASLNARLAEWPPFVNLLTVTICLAGSTVGVQTELAKPGSYKDPPNPVLDALDEIILAIFAVHYPFLHSPLSLSHSQTREFASFSGVCFRFSNTSFPPPSFVRSRTLAHIPRTRLAVSNEQVDIIVKVFGEGLQPLRYFIDPWNKFDFFIVAACYAFKLPFMPTAGSMLSMLRLLRLLRVLKLVKALPQLRIIIEALLSGLSSITFVTIILFMYFYIYANIGMLLFANNDPAHFGTLGEALISLFRISTFDGWTDILYANMLGCEHFMYEYGRHYGTIARLQKVDKANCNHSSGLGWVAAVYFLSFAVIGGQVLLTLFIGIVATSMEEKKAENEDEEKRVKRCAARARQFLVDPLGKEVKLYRTIFDLFDVKVRSSSSQALADRQCLALMR